ncbi:Uncharacterized protein PBTT_08313 [Plasmodiophora brassicae]
MNGVEYWSLVWTAIGVGICLVIALLQCQQSRRRAQTGVWNCKNLPRMALGPGRFAIMRVLPGPRASLHTFDTVLISPMPTSDLAWASSM